VRAPGIVLLLACVLGALLAPLGLAACGGATDPFAGLYWEPSSGRRIEVKRDGDAYKLYYGRDQRAHRAVLDGDQLTITDPMGGRTVLRPGEAEGTLELVTGGETSLLKPLPQHQ
jgi:hypothetical protein